MPLPNDIVQRVEERCVLQYKMWVDDYVRMWSMWRVGKDGVVDAHRKRGMGVMLVMCGAVWVLYDDDVRCVVCLVGYRLAMWV